MCVCTPVGNEYQHFKRVVTATKQPAHPDQSTLVRVIPLTLRPSRNSSKLSVPLPSLSKVSNKVFNSCKRIPYSAFHSEEVSPATHVWLHAELILRYPFLELLKAEAFAAIIIHDSEHSGWDGGGGGLRGGDLKFTTAQAISRYHSQKWVDRYY